MFLFFFFLVGNSPWMGCNATVINRAMEKLRTTVPGPTKQPCLLVRLPTCEFYYAIIIIKWEHVVTSTSSRHFLAGSQVQTQTDSVWYLAILFRYVSTCAKLCTGINSHPVHTPWYKKWRLIVHIGRGAFTPLISPRPAVQHLNSFLNEFLKCLCGQLLSNDWNPIMVVDSVF